MKKKYAIAASLIALMGLSATACSQNSNTAKPSTKTSKVVHKKKKVKLPKADYPTAENAEAALNAGKDLEGKTVRFRVNKVAPKSAFGYNLETGQHLNFVSSRHPKVKVGDIVIVKVKTLDSILGSFVMTYSHLRKVPLSSLSKAEKEKLTAHTEVSNNSNESSDSSSQNQTQSNKQQATNSTTNTSPKSRPKTQGEINMERGYDPNGAPLLPGQDHAAGDDVYGNPMNSMGSYPDSSSSSSNNQDVDDYDSDDEDYDNSYDDYDTDYDEY